MSSGRQRDKFHHLVSMRNLIMLKASGYSEPREKTNFSVVCGIGFPLNINEHNVDCFLEIPASGIFLQIGKHKKHVKQIAFDYAGECLSPLQRLDNWVLTISQSLAGFQSSHLI